MASRESRKLIFLWQSGCYGLNFYLLRISSGQMEDCSLRSAKGKKSYPARTSVYCKLKSNFPTRWSTSTFNSQFDGTNHSGFLPLSAHPIHFLYRPLGRQFSLFHCLLRVACRSSSSSFNFYDFRCFARPDRSGCSTRFEAHYATPLF